MTTKIAPRFEKMSLTACLAMAYRNNPKEHNLDELVASFRRWGFVAFPSIDERTMVMIAGHGRCEALRMLRDSGAEPPAGITVEDDDWIVPVVRGLSFENEKERNAYIIADNQHTIAGGWSLDVLTSELSALDSYEGLGFDQLELQSFGIEFNSPQLEDAPTFEGGHPVDGPPPPSSGTSMVREVDAPDPVPEGKPTITKPGDVWILGDHVLVCGDSTKDGIALAMAVAQQPVGMVWTDPPWNVDYGANPVSSRRERKSENKTIMNDALGDKFPEFLEAFVRETAAATPPGAAIYLAMSVQEWPVIDAKLRATGWHWSSTIIWAKDALVLGRKDFHSQYEPLWYGWREGAPRKHPLKDRAQSDLWEIDRPRRSDKHPTMKPIRLVARAIENSSDYRDLVLDPFGGSGSTLIACEQVGRRSALIELDPRYCDVIVERFEQMTGKKAQRR